MNGLLCKLGEIESDTTNHVFSCLFLKCEVPEVLNLSEDEIDNIFSENLEKSFTTLKIFEKLWRKREVMLQERMKRES